MPTDDIFSNPDVAGVSGGQIVGAKTTVPCAAGSTWRDIPVDASIGPPLEELPGIHSPGIFSVQELARCRLPHSTTVLLKQLPGVWKSVTIDCPTSECIQAFADSLDQATSQPDQGWDSIRSLELRTTKWSAWVEDEDSTQHFFSFIPPSVKALNIHLPSRGSLLLSDGLWDYSFCIPSQLLQGLTSLELTFKAFRTISAPALFETLQDCASLVKLTLDISEAVITDFEPKSSGICLPNLQYLDLRQTNPRTFAALRTLKAPSLRHLRIGLQADSRVSMIGRQCSPPFAVHDPNCHGAWKAKLLKDFIEGVDDTPRPLHSLHIRGASFHTGTLFHLLRDLQSLANLKLEWIELLSCEQDDSSSNLKTHTPSCLPNSKTIQILNLKHPADFEIPSLHSFAGERKISLMLSYHDHAAALEQQRKAEERFRSVLASAMRTPRSLSSAVAVESSTLA